VTYRTLLFEVDDGVAVITLHRPEVRNAFGGGMGEELSDAFRRCDLDDGIRAVVLTGTPPAFCAGADLTAGGDTFAPRDEEGFSAAAVPMPPWDVRKLVIAAVNGHAIGVGFTITLQCDIRIVAAEATCGVVQVRRGVMGDGYSHWTLPRLVGQSAAAEILLTGRTFDGHQLHRMGLCSQVADNAAPLSVAVSKRLLWDTWGRSRDEVEELETALHHHLMAHPDAREGVLSFLERRPPSWQGSPATQFPEWPTAEHRGEA
jgi:enoyl-CoA hydratase/carnithine racemase